MKIPCFVFGITLLVALPVRTETSAQPVDDWYQNRYAPLWKENSWDKVGEISAFYDETLYLHPPDGTITAVASRTWLTNSVEEWKLDGWLGSAVAKYRSDQLNSSSVSFKVKWRDWYTDGKEDFSCGWYMADLNSDEWLITQYAEIDCADHDL